MQFLVTSSTASATDYCRQARRIRASFARDPSLCHRALTELAAQRNAQASYQTARIKTVARRVRPFSQKDDLGLIERDFAQSVADKLQPFGFTFSDRLRLLDSAERLGISRFRANMILAMHEHSAPARPAAAPEVPARSVAPSLLVILSVEAMVVGVLVFLVGL